MQQPAWWTRERVIVLLGFLAAIILLILTRASVLRAQSGREVGSAERRTGIDRRRHSGGGRPTAPW
ncbi:MAG: hypothetical protein WDO73_21875 [Ignavibacteriota bacterium]